MPSSYFFCSETSSNRAAEKIVKQESYKFSKRVRLYSKNPSRNSHVSKIICITSVAEDLLSSLPEVKVNLNVFKDSTGDCCQSFSLRRREEQSW